MELIKCSKKNIVTQKVKINNVEEWIKRTKGYLYNCEKNYNVEYLLGCIDYLEKIIPFLYGNTLIIGLGEIFDIFIAFSIFLISPGCCDDGF